MAEKKASLTVLGGPLAGTRFVLEGLGPEVLLGSDPACPFRLDLTGVSPHHAKVTAGPDGFTIEDAGSVQGLHVNDSLVTGSSPLRNGDIVWLGTPGEADVVMLQCILPTRPAAPAAPPPSPEPADASLSDDETLALALEQSEGAAVRAEVSLHEEAATAFYTADEAAAASASYTTAEAEAAEPPFATGHAAEPELVMAEDETVAQGVPFAIDSPPPPPPAAHFEDDTREQTYVFEEESSTVVMGGPDVGASHVAHEATEFVEEAGATVVMGSDPIDIAPPFVSEPPKTEFIPKPAVPPPAAVAPPAPPPPAPRAARPAASPAPASPSSPAARPARPAGPGASQSIPASRRPVARPAAAPPRDEVEGGGGEDEAPRGKPSPPVALYAGIGVAALVVIGGGLFAARRFMGGTPPPTLAEAPPTTVAVAPPRTTPAATPPPVEARPEATPEPVALPTPAAVEPSTPTTTLKAAPTPSPLATPTPAAKKGAPTPAPAATPAGPSPEQLRAQQVAGLLGQAEAAVAAGQLDQAIGHFDEVLRLDPGNARATADRASAVSRRAAASKRFVAGRTIVKTEKAAGGLSGFEGAAVQKTPDFSGRIEFEMSPSSGIKPGDPWTLKIYLVNDGKKGIKVGGVTASTVVNGAAGSGGPVTAATREVGPQQRALLGQTGGSWQDGTTAWSADVLVTANKGDSLQSTISWK